ncbi:MAG: DUF2160 family membrane protein [Chloroflexota bacterium]
MSEVTIFNGTPIEWMRWTVPTLIFVVGIFVMLGIMTIWDVRSPSVKTKGILPFGFTRGDRLFLSIMTVLGTSLLWMAFLPDQNLLFAFPVAGVIIFGIVRWA